MPDLETLVSVCSGGSSDRKIACETQVIVPATDTPDLITVRPDPIPPDLPPESFCLSKDAELEWLESNAFFERKDSQKGNSNSNPNPIPNLSSSSQRISIKPKSSLFGLPKPQITCYAVPKTRRNSKSGTTTRLFPKWTGSRGKSDQPETEPSSPKVSCMGRVRSKRDRNRRQLECEKTNNPKPVKKPGLFQGFMSIFRLGNRKQSPARGSHSISVQTPPRLSVAVNDIRSRLPPSDAEAVSPPRKSTAARNSFEGVGLGGMKRFASGRRSNLLEDDVIGVV